MSRRRATSVWEQLAALPHVPTAAADTKVAISEAEEDVDVLRQRLRAAKVAEEL